MIHGVTPAEEESMTLYCPRTGKIKHASSKEASLTMRGMQRKKPNRVRQTNRLNVFHCRACGCWHVGNKEK